MDTNVVFPGPGSPRRPNTVRIGYESPGHPTHKSLAKKGGHAGLASVDFKSDIPLSYSYHLDRVGDIFRPRSENITVWKILHVARNCGNIISDRNVLLEKLMKRGLVDSYGGCHHNKDWSSTEKYPPREGGGGKEELVMHKYAFVTAFENSYWPG